MRKVIRKMMRKVIRKKKNDWLYRLREKPLVW